MEMDKVLESLEILSVCNATLLAFFLFRAKSENRKANNFLALFLLSLTLEIIFSLEMNHDQTMVIFPPTNLLTILLLFFYVKHTVNEKLNLAYHFLFVPAIVQISCYYFVQEENYFFQLIEYGMNVFLLIKILLIQKKHLSNLKNYYSNIEHKSLSWIRTIALAFLAFYVLWITEDIIGIINPKFIAYFSQASIILTFFVIMWIAYTSFEHNEIFRIKLFDRKKNVYERNAEVNNENPLVNVQDVSDNYGTEHIEETKEASCNNDTEESTEEQKEGEKEDKADENLKLFEKAKQQIIEERLYANPKLNLRILAEKLDINEKRLSGLINQYTKMNFYNFINSLRIEEFKKLLNSPKAAQLSTLGLAYEVGFSSKSTFYTAFKNIVGMTPTEFRLKNSPNGSSRTSSSA